jgi:hypothetical protein
LAEFTEFCGTVWEFRGLNIGRRVHVERIVSMFWRCQQKARSFLGILRNTPHFAIILALVQPINAPGNVVSGNPNETHISVLEKVRRECSPRTLVGAEMSDMNGSPKLRHRDAKRWFVD